MQYGGPDVYLRTIVVAALMSSSVFASARAAQVEVSNPANVAVLEDAGTIDITFEVTNTGMPDNVKVHIGDITEFIVRANGDVLYDILAAGSILTTNCGALGAKDHCTLLARYNVKDGDPLDEHDTDNKGGLWVGGISVLWQTTTGIRGVSVGRDLVLVEDAKGVGSFAVPEPSTWAIMLVGFSALGLAGYFRARSRQDLTTA